MENLVLTDEEEKIVGEGLAAKALLDSPVFLTAIDKVRNDCAERILTSSPDAAEKREQDYHLSRALSALTIELTALVSDAETLIENAARTDNPTPPADDVQEEPDVPRDY